MRNASGGTSLERGLQRLYAQALAQRNWEVAEHLLCALEAMARRTGQNSGAQRAYLGLARTALHGVAYEQAGREEPASKRS